MKDIQQHVDNCNICIQGKRCNQRDFMFKKYAEKRNGQVVAMHKSMTARVIGSYLQLTGRKVFGEQDATSITETIALTQSEGLALEEGLRGWLHSDD
jgi:hypothetical protein